MENNVSRKEALEIVGKIIKGVRVAMLTTVSANGELHSRPMATQDSEFDGDLWFFTARDSAKAADIRINSQVNVGYLGDNAYLSLSGKATLVDDLAKKRELWNDMLKVWFEDGADSPEVVLIHVNAESAQFWDGVGEGAIGKMISFVKMFIMREEDSGGKMGNVDL